MGETYRDKLLPIAFRLCMERLVWKLLLVTRWELQLPRKRLAFVWALAPEELPSAFEILPLSLGFSRWLIPLL
jgi:hypothetical protein